jgi:hypothetical protein
MEGLWVWSLDTILILLWFWSRKVSSIHLRKEHHLHEFLCLRSEYKHHTF